MNCYSLTTPALRSGSALSTASHRVLALRIAESHISAPSTSGGRQRRNLGRSSRMDAKFAPAKRVAGQKQDVWSIVNEAAAASPVQPIVNMGQGFL